MKNKWTMGLSVVYSVLGVMMLFLGLIFLFVKDIGGEFLLIIGLSSLMMGVLFGIYHTVEDMMEILKSLKQTEELLEAKNGVGRDIN